MKLFQITHTWVWYSSVGDYFCQEDPKGPDIRFDAERPKVDGLWSRPFNGKLSTWLLDKSKRKKMEGSCVTCCSLWRICRCVRICVNVYFPFNVGWLMGRKYSEIMRKLSIREFTDHSVALINLWVLFSCFLQDFQSLWQIYTFLIHRVRQNVNTISNIYWY